MQNTSAHTWCMGFPSWFNSDVLVQHRKVAKQQTLALVLVAVSQ